MRPLAVAMLIATYTTIGHAEFAEADSYFKGIDDERHEGKEGRSHDCGTLSLYMLLGLERNLVDFPALAAAMPGGPYRSHSLKELGEVAGRFGLTLCGRQLSSESFPRDRPLIAHLDRKPHGHFVVVRFVGHSGHLVQILDPSDVPRIIDLDKLIASPEWTGMVLSPCRGMSIGRILLACGLAISAFLFCFKGFWPAIHERFVRGIMRKRRYNDVTTSAIRTKPEI